MAVAAIVVAALALTALGAVLGVTVHWALTTDRRWRA